LKASTANPKTAVRRRRRRKANRRANKPSIWVGARDMVPRTIAHERLGCQSKGDRSVSALGLVGIAAPFGELSIFVNLTRRNFSLRIH
jgi:hypothetical protein